MEPTVEQLNDPDWWDENAPECATHYTTGESRIWELHDGDDRFFWFCGLWRKRGSTDDITEAVVHRPQRTPTTQPWRGPEDGLPQIGSFCELKHDDNYHRLTPVEEWVDGDKLEVLAHKDAGDGQLVAVVWNCRSKFAKGLVADLLQPIQTKREKAYSLFFDIFGENNSGMMNEFLDKLGIE